MRSLLILITLVFSATSFAELNGGASTTTKSNSQFSMKPDKAQVEKLIGQWPQESSKAAKAIMTKYGVPAEATESMLVWKNNHPWKRTIVMREGVDHMFPKKHLDVVQQWVDFKVPVDKIDDLAQFNGSIIFDRTRGEIAARSDSEESNFLSLNLAKEIVDGKKSVQEARSQYAKSFASMTSVAAKDYTKGLGFSATGNSADPDTAFSESTSSTTGTTGSSPESSSPSGSNLNSPEQSAQESSSSTGGITESAPIQDPATGETSDKSTESED